MKVFVFFLTFIYGLKSTELKVLNIIYLVEQVAQRHHIQEILGLNLCLDTRNLHCCILWYSSVPSDKCPHTTGH